MSQRLNIAILYGGKSVEHEVSIRSAKNVVANIDSTLYKVILLGIDKKGTWYLNNTINDKLDAGHTVSLKLNALAPHLITNHNNEEVKIDVVFPILHGTDGEDGGVQGLFKAMNLPVVGSCVLGSAISMDKIISKQVLKECGIPVAGYIEFHRSQKGQISFDNVVKQVGLPLMIKSSALGSSVGISMVSGEEEFSAALEDSFQYGEKILIESFVKGRELECAVMGNDHPKASMPGEIIMVKDYDFYTYEAKYLDEEAIQIKIPADVDHDILDEIRKLSIDAYNALRCDDYARVDLFLTENNEIIINEINTIPGFTNASMFPMMWKQMGLTFKELISEIIVLCLDRFNATKNLETSYNLPN